MSAIRFAERSTDAATTSRSRPVSIGIFYHADPAGHIPSGIDTIIRGVLKWAPSDLNYTLFGATSDPVARPIDRQMEVPLGDGVARFVPIIAADPTAARKRIPLTVRYLLALRRHQRAGFLDHLDILDFHRVEALGLFRADTRPKNLMIHQDMEVLRSKNSDIGWSRAPWLYEWMEARLLQNVDRVFCVRQSAAARYQRIFPARADRFSFLPTWVDTTVFHPTGSPAEWQLQRHRLADSLSVAPSIKLLVWVGRLDRQKDPMLLLDSMKALKELQPDFHLLMVGDGSMRQPIEDRIRSHGLQGHVTLLGSVTPARIADILRVADLFVLSSAYEGMPIAVLEALASGIPVVATEVGEVRLVVRDGANGFIVTDRAAGSFARKVAQALTLGESMRGEPCALSVAAYVPERVLRRIYDNHRSQGAARAEAHALSR